MAEYDNTNTGAAFAPFPSQSMILQGKVDIMSKQSKVVCVKDQTKNGRNIVEVYAKIAVLFENDKKGNDNAPDYSGPIDETEHLKIAGWKRMKDGKPYMSFKISEKQEGMSNTDSASSALPNDNIPF
jgi:hypothetical protein